MLKRFTYQFGRCIRETGQALDRVGLTALGSNAYEEKFSRHRQIMNIYDKRPVVAYDSWVAPNATIIGDVEIGNEVSIWYGCVIRGDLNRVQIGFRSNVQDRTVIHTTAKTMLGLVPGTIIGEDVTIGHGCTLYSCTIEDNVMIGMGSIILDGAIIESNTIIAAGTVVPPGRKIPKGQLWAGNPAKYIRDLTDDEIIANTKHAEEYRNVSQTHSDEFLPYGTVYLDAERAKSKGEKL